MWSEALRRARTFGALTLSVTTLAQAQPAPESLQVGGFGSCPDANSVRAAILQLTSARSRAALAPGSTVFVNDQGESFRVSITTVGSDAERTYSDPARNCERRARFAAVFAIVTLMPPDFDDSSEAEPTEPTPTPAPEPASASAARTVVRKQLPLPRAELPAPPWLRLALLAAAEQALDPNGKLTLRGFGGELLGVFGRARLAPAVSLAFAPARELALPDTRCELMRAEAVLGARVTEPAGPVTLGADLGLAFAWSRVRGAELAHPATSSTMDFGLRARGVATLASSALSPLLGVEAALFPFSSELHAEPRGKLGRLPLLWLGVALGVQIGL